MHDTPTPRPVTLADLPHEPLRSGATGEAYSLSALAAPLWGLRGLFVHHDIVPAGRAMSAPHRHSAADELVVVMSGEVVAVRDGVRSVLRSGDAIGFPAGDPETHVVRNESAADAHVLVVASRPGGDRVRYPDDTAAPDRG